MAYSKHRYESRLERRKRIDRNTRVVLAFIVVAIAIMVYKERVYIWDTLRFYF